MPLTSRFALPGRRRCRRAIVVSTVIALAALATTAATGAVGSTQTPGAMDDVVDQGVSFRVRNTNTSGVPCATDGRSTVRGRLAGPRWALNAGSPLATLYLHGFAVSGFGWEFDAVPGYDYLAEMARLGHVSVSIDFPGYDRSGKPDGRLVCLGAYADISQQIIDQLRSGGYSAGGDEATAFDRIVLAGHDIGGPVAEIAAYSYSDIDGLMILGYADQGFTATVLDWGIVRPLPGCLLGGQSVVPGGPRGYETYPPTVEDARRAAFADIDPAVLEGVLQRVQFKQPCGVFQSLVPTVLVNNLRLGEIKVPVHLLYAERDFVYSREGTAAQAGRFGGSADVTTEYVDTGHFPWLERKAPLVRAGISDWLRSRGFVSRPSPATP